MYNNTQYCLVFHISQRGFSMRIFAVALLSLALAACGGGEPTNPNDASAKAAREIISAMDTAASRMETSCTSARQNAACPAQYDVDKAKAEVAGWKWYATYLTNWHNGDKAVVTSLAEGFSRSSSYHSGRHPGLYFAYGNGKEGYYEPSQELKSFMRKELADAGKLKLAYSIFGADVIKLVVQDAGYAKLVAWKSEVRPVLQKLPNLQLSLLYTEWHYCTFHGCEDESQVEQKAEAELYVKQFTAHYGVSPTFVSGWTAQFLVRRTGEGGNNLVKAWQEILLDSLKEVE